MEVAHGVRLDMFVDATALEMKNVRGRHTRVLALCEISVARKMIRLRCIQSVVKRQSTHGN